MGKTWIFIRKGQSIPSLKISRLKTRSLQYTKYCPNHRASVLLAFLNECVSVYLNMNVFSVQTSLSVVFDSLWPHGLQHARLPCLSPTPGVYSNSCPSHRWCHPTISTSVVPFSSPFNLSHHQGLFQWVSSSHQAAKVLAFRLQPQSFQWISGLISFRIDWLDLLGVQGTLKSFQYHSSKASVLQHSAFFTLQLHIHTRLLEKP